MAIHQPLAYHVKNGYFECSHGQNNHSLRTLSFPENDHVKKKTRQIKPVYHQGKSNGKKKGTNEFMH